MLRQMSSGKQCFVPVEEELMGLVIGAEGRKIKEIQENTRTRIRGRSRNGKESGFEVTGAPNNCVQAELAIRRSIVSELKIVFLFSFLPINRWAISGSYTFSRN